MNAGATDMQKRMPGASLSKWPAALTIAGLVADGVLPQNAWPSCGTISLCFKISLTKLMPCSKVLSHRGTLSFDDKANKHLDWWSKEASDPRSNITLRHLLTFQSGNSLERAEIFRFSRKGHRRG